MADEAQIQQADAGAGSGAGAGIPRAYADAWQGGSSMAMAMFAPGTPVAPRVPDEEKPRVFDYGSGINLYMVPRSGYGLLPFVALKNFADLCDAVRIVVEAIKREIRALEWDIRPIDEQDDADYGAEIRRLRAFWARPDGVTEFDGWCNAILEDLLVYDAVTLWLDQDESGALLSAEQIDGKTIRPLLDIRGRIPRPPVPGYMQAIKGANWQWFTADRLIYRPYNTSADSPYGRSPIEYLIIRINEALRRQMSNTAYWDQTNVPEAMVGLPEQWTIDQIREFQNYFDALLVGNIDKLRRLKFMPVHAGAMPVYEFRRPDADASAVFDEWLVKMTCWAFGFLPSELGLVAGGGLGGKGFMEGQENAQYRFGLGPMIQYLQNLFTGIVARQTSAPLAFRFVNIGPDEDKLIQAQVMEKQLQNGVIDINVWRQKEGQDPIENARPFMVLNGQVVLLDDIFNPPPAPPPAPRSEWPVLSDGAGSGAAPIPDSPSGALPGAPGGPDVTKEALSHWREKVAKRMGEGKPALCEPTTLAKALLPASVVECVKSGLAAGDVEGAFRAGLEVPARPFRGRPQQLGQQSRPAYP